MIRDECGGQGLQQSPIRRLGHCGGRCGLGMDGVKETGEVNG